jgi:polyisoprenoid-binding protein YceI
VPEPTALAASADDSRTLFSIAPAESTAAFAVEETLKGNRITATGATSNLAGSLLLDMADLSATVVGPINIDATSFRTDDPNRDRAINKWLLVSRAYPLIAFTPTAVSNLPPAATIGDSLTFAIEGELTITTYTQPVTFTVTATAVSADRIEGTAVSTIQRDDFKLRIPSAPGVADVAETITLTFDFVALGE